MRSRDSHFNQHTNLANSHLAVLLMFRLLALTITLLSCSAYKVRMPARNLQMSASKNIKAGMIAVLASGLLSMQPSPAFAANYGGFGSSYAEVVAPKDAVLDEELAAGEDFKQGVEGLGKILSKVRALHADFKANNQLDVHARFESDFRLSDIRNSLNKFSAAFSEDTQKGGDRLIRQVIQGITELDRESIIKEGKQRSSARAAVVEKRLASIESSLDSLSQYYKK